MTEIKITTAKKETLYHVPASFNEMTREQFILTAAKILHAITGIEDETYYATMTGIEPKVYAKLHFYQRYNIRQLFDFVTETSPPITKQLLPYIIIDEKQFIGYQPGFSNTTWQEFIFADQYIINGKYREAAACLYRPQRPDYTGETDRRIPFTIYGTDTRMKFFSQLPEAELLAFVLNYKSLRKTHLEEKYSFIFSNSKSHVIAGLTRNPHRSPSTVLPVPFSWVAIHRDLMGDHFYDETKFYELNVHVILNRMNTVIQEHGTRRNGT